MTSNNLAEREFGMHVSFGERQRGTRTTKCGICGKRSTQVYAETIWRQSFTSRNETAELNRITVCPSCHKLYRSDIEKLAFLCVLVELLNHHPDFTEVGRGLTIHHKVRLGTDLFARRTRSSRKEHLFIECITSGTHSWFTDEIIRLRRYAEMYEDCRLVVAVPAQLSPEVSNFLRHQDVELWDRTYIGKIFNTQLSTVSSRYYKQLFLTHMEREAVLSTEQQLLSRFKLAVPGRRDWIVYQRLVGDVLKQVFHPAFQNPNIENSDFTKTNRRDYIFPNYAEDGFWAFMRSEYKAHYIVVEVKNYAGKLRKSQILQLANYLKPHGVGLFGIIICRTGEDTSGCQMALREQWQLHRKLILILKDEDLEAMLLAKACGRTPETLIETKIRDFRISM